MALARALRIPDLTVGAEHDSFGADSASRIGAGVSIGIPVFNRAQGLILRSNAEYKQIEEQVKKIKRVIVSDVRQGLISYRASLTVFGAYKERSGFFSGGNYGPGPSGYAQDLSRFCEQI